MRFNFAIARFSQVLTAICGLLVCGPAVRGLEAIPDRLVVLTFDDSIHSHFTMVRDVLQRHQFGATFFITEGFDFKTNKQDYMTWEQIAQLHEDGFEIGNHTRDHMSLDARKPERLQQLKEQIEAINARCAEFGIPRTTSFAYPGNGLDPAALPVLRELESGLPAAAVRLSFRMTKDAASPMNRDWIIRS